MRRILAPLCAAVLLAAAGCAAPPPPPPLMSPHGTGGHDYGYAEERLGADLWRVVYHGPWRALDQAPAPRRAQLDRAAAEAADLALWRAAQLALADGRPAFAVLDRRTDTEIDRRRGGWVDDPWWHSSGYPFGRGSFIHRPWPATYYVPGFAYGRARMTLTTRLERRVTPANTDAAATARRLEPLYVGRGPINP